MMRIRIITIAHKIPGWIEQGSAEYLKRMKMDASVTFVDIPAVKRSASEAPEVVMNREGEKIVAMLKSQSQHATVMLDRQGESWSTEQLAKKMGVYQDYGKTVDFVIGGPEGLSKDCLTYADERWSLSALTFPHALVRIILLEQLYRSFCIMKQHPYHR